VGFTKLDSGIIYSSIWGESSDIRIVWVTMLAMADQNGNVMASVPGLSRAACVPVKIVEEALAKFLSPDRYSRTPDNDGKRISTIDGGWNILNHGLYRSHTYSDSADAIRMRMNRAERRRTRSEHGEHSASASVSASVSVSSSKEKEIVIPTKKEVEAYCNERGNSVDPEKFVSYYEAHGWQSNGKPVSDWKALIRYWESSERKDGDKSGGFNF